MMMRKSSCMYDSEAVHASKWDCIVKAFESNLEHQKRDSGTGHLYQYCCQRLTVVYDPYLLRSPSFPLALKTFVL